MLCQHSESCYPPCFSTHTCSIFTRADMTRRAPMFELSSWFFHSAQRDQPDRINNFGVQMADCTSVSLTSISEVCCCSSCTICISVSLRATCPYAFTQILYCYCRERLNFYSIACNATCTFRRTMYPFQRTVCNCGIHLITISGCVSLTKSSEVCSCRFSGLRTRVQTALALAYADPQRASIIHHRGGPSNDTHCTLLGEADHAGRLRGSMTVPWTTNASPMHCGVFSHIMCQPHITLTHTHTSVFLHCHPLRYQTIRYRHRVRYANDDPRERLDSTLTPGLYSACPPQPTPRNANIRPPRSFQPAVAEHLTVLSPPRNRHYSAGFCGNAE